MCKSIEPNRERSSNLDHNRNPNDTDNLLTFIQLLRKMLDDKYPKEHKLITAAVSAYVFKGSDGNPITSLDKAWANYMDAFYVMVTIFS